MILWNCVITWYWFSHRVWSTCLATLLALCLNIQRPPHLHIHAHALSYITSHIRILHHIGILSIQSFFHCCTAFISFISPSGIQSWFSLQITGPPSGNQLKARVVCPVGALSCLAFQFSHGLAKGCKLFKVAVEVSGLQRMLVGNIFSDEGQPAVVQDSYCRWQLGPVGRSRHRV